LHMNFHPQNNTKQKFLVHNIGKELNRSNLKMVLNFVVIFI